METKLVLGENRLVRMPETLIAEEKGKRIIALESSVYDLGKVTVTIKNGFKQKKLVVTNQKVDITEFCDRACKIEIKVDLIMLGKETKTWYLEPIVVREINGDFELIPELVDVRERLGKAEADLAHIKNYLFDIL